MAKSIKRIIPAQKVNMGGHWLDQPLPAEGIEYIDPFLLIHHWSDTLPGGEWQQNVGVGPHPHRGFSPVTFIFKGAIHHRDSFGNDAVVEAGGTQWMFAGRGVTHSERPSRALARDGGDLEIIQFWVNAPAAHKMDAPDYRALSKEDTPTVREEGLEVQVVCGSYQDTQGAVSYFTPLNLLRWTLGAGTKKRMLSAETENTSIYLLDGKLRINDREARAKDLIWLERDGDHVALEALEDTRFIVLSGVPLQQDVSTYGPFVMSTQTELMEAIRDAQMGKMGVLIEEFDTEV